MSCENTYEPKQTYPPRRSVCVAYLSGEETGQICHRHFIPQGRHDAPFDVAMLVRLAVVLSAEGHVDDGVLLADAAVKG